MGLHRLRAHQLRHTVYANEATWQYDASQGLERGVLLRSRRLIAILAQAVSLPAGVRVIFHRGRSAWLNT
jgi:hypothetical protein